MKAALARLEAALGSEAVFAHGIGGAVRIRSDSSWNVPEGELALAGRLVHPLTGQRARQRRLGTGFEALRNRDRERKLMKIILMPSLVVVWVLGLALAQTLNVWAAGCDVSDPASILRLAAVAIAATATSRIFCTLPSARATPISTLTFL